MKLDKHSPLLPAKYDPSDSFAVHALASGTASGPQQKQALDWIIKVLCRTYDEAFIPGEDGTRQTDYLLGMQHVGRQLVKHANGIPGLKAEVSRQSK